MARRAVATDHSSKVRDHEMSGAIHDRVSFAPQKGRERRRDSVGQAIDERHVHPRPTFLSAARRTTADVSREQQTRKKDGGAEASSKRRGAADNP
eukprot:scaffold1785_cov247-Pinguiococcus_pyrenoidosus.AAC.2